MAESVLLEVETYVSRLHWGKIPPDPPSKIPPVPSTLPWPCLHSLLLKAFLRLHSTLILRGGRSNSEPSLAARPTSPDFRPMLVCTPLYECPIPLAPNSSSLWPMLIVLLGSGWGGGCLAVDSDPLDDIGFHRCDDLGFIWRSWIPNPFPRATVRVPNTLPTNGRFFCGRPACPPFCRYALDPVILLSESTSRGLRAPPPPTYILMRLLHRGPVAPVYPGK